MGPDLNLLENLSSKGLSTPLTFGGRINCLEHAIAVIKLGAERICVDYFYAGQMLLKRYQFAWGSGGHGVITVCMKDGELN